MTIIPIGQLVGSYLLSRVSDLYGRRPVFLFSLFCLVSLGMLQAIVPTYLGFMIVGFFEGFLAAGLGSTVLILCLELFPPEHRSLAGAILNYFWTVGYILITPVAYYIRNWRTFKLAINAPMVLCISFYWIIPESLNWLIVNGRVREAQAIIDKGARINKVKSPKLSKLKNTPPEPPLAFRQRFFYEWHKLRKIFSIRKPNSRGERPTYNLSDIWRSKTLRRNTLAMCWLWITNNFTYSSLSLTVTFLKGNRYLNFFIYAILEVPACLLAHFCLVKIGRRMPMMVFHVICALSLIISAICDGSGVDSLASTIIKYCAKLSISTTYNIVFVMVPEIYPTNIRSLGTGICLLAGRLVGHMAPFARTWERNNPIGPALLCGFLNLAASGACWILPETLNKPLPDTIEELETQSIRRIFMRNKKKTNDKTVLINSSDGDEINDSMSEGVFFLNPKF
ncbi:DgyrCDS12942 [Dimorphilus gyrociliatus]|uniref:DgyrCDS12942 n=1 Tax=Dimorphilus gyrociliatus TaxID=2664684 RepID=A0A7I8W960_9ANNE|nr:DgyrCDS12942 [Dimorphilus gyrociliatus]